MHDSASPRGKAKGEEQHASASSDSRNGESYHALDIKDDAYDDGGYDPTEHSPMYNVDMDPGDRTAVFDLALDDDSDDGGGLLDWNLLAGKQKRKCCWCDWSWLPGLSGPGPSWWRALSARQRLAVQGCAVFCLVVALFAIIVVITLSVYR